MNSRKKQKQKTDKNHRGTRLSCVSGTVMACFSKAWKKAGRLFQALEILP